jgi:hypothetical protein
VFHQYSDIESHYEVVKSVGFDFVSTLETGARMRFAIRVDVVRFYGSGELAPMIWQVAPGLSDALLLHTSPADSTIRGATPEDVIAAVLQVLHPKT